MNVPLNEIITHFNDNTWAILRLINRQPDVSLLGIRKELELSQTKAQIEIARLEGAACIRTERNQNDQRLVIYTVTSYGQFALDL